MTASVEGSLCGEGFAAADEAATVDPENVLVQGVIPAPLQLRELGLSNFERSDFVVHLLMRVDDTATVQSVRMVLFDHKPAEVSWVLGTPYGCGGALFRRGYSVDLDGEPLLLKPDGDWDGANASRGFSVSQDDPTELAFSVSGCDGLYEFGIRLEYTVRGSDHVLMVGSEDEPFRLLGGDPKQILEQDPDSGEIREQSTGADDICGTEAWADQGLIDEEDLMSEGEEDGSGAPGGSEVTEEMVNAACARWKDRLTAAQYYLVGCADDQEFVTELSAICAILSPVASQRDLYVLGCVDESLGGGR
jgi:hypothetical protein